MRVKVVGAVLAAAAVLLLAGCGGMPPGVDGNLTDDWSAMPAATIAVPPAPACYDVTDPQPGMTRLPPVVDCGKRHTLETVQVGSFIGADAATDVPPPDGGPAQQRAYADCTQRADAWVGGDWRTGRIGLDLTLPDPAQWTAGARWYRCDLVEFTDLDSAVVAARTGSIQGALAGQRPLALGCFTVATKSEDIDTMVATDCTAPHNSEFAGVWDAPPGAYPVDPDKRQTIQLNGCRGVVASFAGIPDDGMVRYRTGQITFGFGKAEWDLGNRGARCYLWMNSRTVTRSLKGAGTRGLPVNTA